VTFRARLALVSAAAVAIAVVAASAGAYLVVRDELRSEIDAQLRDRVERGLRPLLEGRREGPFEAVPGPAFGGAAGYAQLVAADGRTFRPRGERVPLPVSDDAAAVARGEAQQHIEDATVDGVHLRILTVALPNGAVQVARPLDEVDGTLDRVRTALLFVGAAGIGIAAVLGLLVSGAAIGPLTRLTRAAEQVAETRDLSRRVGVAGTDEIGRLGERFDDMLAALEESQQAQRQLVADASHELRTPITGIRTNIDLLARHADLPTEQREAALGTARGQLEELSTLVTDLVELARNGSEAAPPLEPFRLDAVVDDAVVRARSAHPGTAFALDADESVVDGVPERVQRAVSNLLDNAAKFSGADGVVEVSVRDGTVTVRDHGPGFDEQDLPHVFDRFYRAASARGTVGSGLGLAIVRQVAETHGGSVTAANAPDGGAIVSLTLLRSP
jgi:two-component system sensor histidine kinase MprB